MPHTWSFQLHATVLLLAVLFGLAVGSFLNVCIHRIPRRQSLLFPGSHCPACKSLLRWYHNIPLLSYVFLLGRCSFCGVSISPRYPFIELFNGFLWGYIVLEYGVTPLGVAMLAFASTLIVVYFIDLEFKIIPNVITYPGTLAGVALAAAGVLPVSLKDSLLGAAAGFLVIHLIRLVYLLVAGQEGMGQGDAKYLAFVGAFLGWKLVLFTLIGGAVLGTLVMLPLLLSRRVGAKTEIPFGPFLVVSTAVAVMWGNDIVGWYLGLF